MSETVSLEKPLNAVKSLFQNVLLCEVNHSYMPASTLRGKPASVDQKDMFFVKQLQHEGFVVIGPY